MRLACEEELRDILLAELSQLPFSTFEETDEGLAAYIESTEWDRNATQTILDKYAISDFEISEIEKKNWNEEWEKNFDPIRIDDRLEVRAPFHSKSQLPLEIIILPKMSFGTGHHATTRLILEYQLELDHAHKKVLDVGCGTGVLAIMAHKMGAKNIQAFDIEDWCVENSRENFALNDCPEIVVEQKEIVQVQDADFEIILANITKGVHEDLMDEYRNRMVKNGTLVLSGFFESDISELRAEAERSGFQYVESKSYNDWARLVCRKL